MSDSTGLPLESNQVTAQATAPGQACALSVPQSTVLCPSLPTFLLVRPWYWAGGFALSAKPHQLMLFVNWLWASRTAFTTLSAESPFAVVPIHHFLVVRQ